MKKYSLFTFLKQMDKPSKMLVILGILAIILPITILSFQIKLPSHGDAFNKREHSDVISSDLLIKGDDWMIGTTLWESGNMAQVVISVKGKMLYANNKKIGYISHIGNTYYVRISNSLYSSFAGRYVFD